ncbi:hypothetical protein CDAR_481051 [Caerostris darwini]|uniref:Retrotransposon gag domain-containing protein n=1 Tax=Caerostris darwini TaxID=1538125 RepID=A0AAV4W4F2_9ARAC|nr:hypothetical protein CDAR_481051 [Caerostris darwini]
MILAGRNLETPGVDDQRNTMASSLKDAAETWDSLQEQFNSKSISFVTTIGRLLQMKFDAKKSIAIFIAKVKKMAKCVADAGHLLEDLEQYGHSRQFSRYCSVFVSLAG